MDESRLQAIPVTGLARNVHRLIFVWTFYKGLFLTMLLCTYTFGTACGIFLQPGGTRHVKHEALQLFAQRSL